MLFFCFCFFGFFCLFVFFSFVCLVGGGRFLGFFIVFFPWLFGWLADFFFFFCVFAVVLGISFVWGGVVSNLYDLLMNGLEVQVRLSKRMTTPATNIKRHLYNIFVSFCRVLKKLRDNGWLVGCLLAWGWRAAVQRCRKIEPAKRCK